MSRTLCRLCAAPLELSFVDLGVSPLCQTHVEPDRLDAPETFHPLHARVCGHCFLVQVPHQVSPTELFGDYAYFSSYSDSWLAHARAYVAASVERLRLDAGSHVVEIASNDGYLLHEFVARGIPCLGVEPAANVARVAIARGVPTVVRFFTRAVAQELAREHGAADLIVANNVLAHVPDPNDFVAGLAVLLKPHGVATLEFPHLLRLMRENQFDTIYHEHFSYFSLRVARTLFERHGLAIVEVDELPTHGGSLRIHARHRAAAGSPSGNVTRVLADETAAGLDRPDGYAGFAEQVYETKRALLAFLIEARRAGKRVAGYGAPGKGNTLLNFCGIRTDLLEYTVDRSPHKQGRYTPGTRIPIRAPETIFATRPDYVLILPWNLAQEITAQMQGIREWGGRFVVPIPTLTVL
ncbi:MAG: methyltransferase domain-containing protein [Burkholderiales bacterium]